ncbi:MAG: sodium:proton antiporter [Lachnospiraceae bacterium]|nr:sodium:proton antiporter [Lachnospiraceae bacterium]
MEWIALGLFCAALLICILLDLSVLYALAFGLLVFLLYGRTKGFPWRELFGMALEGIKTVHNILITFFLIGIMTALWRAAGTIPVIVCYASGLIRPAVFLLMAFLLNCAVSVLTGTSFGTAATMGVICAAIGTAMGVSPLLSGGAVLSGAFFGDRCSPVSTSALLVAAVTKTDIYDNIRRMVRTAFVPFLLACGIYTGIGLLLPREGSVMDLEALFSRSFSLHWTALIPAAVILVLAAFRVKVKLAMSVSILTAIPLCLILQGLSPTEILRAALSGFTPADAEVARLVSGGGIVSMLRVACIVCLSSAYSGIFQKTGMLDKAKRLIGALAAKTNAYTASLITSVLTGVIACNQTLTILLTEQLCRDEYAAKENLAIDLEDSAVVTAPLVPWSIAGAVPLASVGAPSAAVLAAFYLILLPLWRLVRGVQIQKK